MPTNKNAQIRYQALDKCLGNWARRYYIEDLIEACNEALYIYNGDSGKELGVKKRQVQEDLKFIESEEGYRMTIEAIQDGHKKYYRYSKRNASIKEQPINQEEINLIHDALTLLKRFEGVPQFDWLEEVQNHLYSTSKLGDNGKTVVSFQNNPYLKGMSFYKPLFDAIVNRRVIDLKYQPFGKDERTITVSPYHLKQYNNRWFLIAKRNDLDEFFSNYAIDRIVSVEETSKPYEPLDEDFDFDDYYSDVVGVSVTNNPVETIVLHVNEKALGYIMTKPLHESQSTKPTQLKDGKWEISIKVKENYELMSLLRSFGDGIEIVKPDSFRDKMNEMVIKMANMYRKG
ncbi:MAG: WYL domain-containing protein [Massilibacteroides sp.]|nr:WYL domain-containing protein [Massilibacteroides sp.]